jgi:pimeloyl-ACP methyl ester carboxylesterase
MGGYVALAYGEKYSEGIIGLGLFHSTAFADNELKIETRKKAIAFITENGSSAFLKTTTPGLFYDKEKNQSAIETLLANANQFEKETLAAYYKSIMNRPDRTAVLRNASYPVLFIAGQHDIAVPLSDSLKQAALSELTFFYLLKNSGHMGMVEEKDKANEIIQTFLQTTTNHIKRPD